LGQSCGSLLLRLSHGHKSECNQWWIIDFNVCLILWTWHCLCLSSTSCYVPLLTCQVLPVNIWWRNAPNKGSRRLE
jgi:hypothetical protein